MNGQYSSLDEFWPFYVSQHLNPSNRLLHFYGTTLGIVLGIAALVWRAPYVAVAGLVVAYGFAWVGHFFYEKNRPATFNYPLLSFRADFRMYRLTMLGQMGAEILLLTKKLKDLRADESPRS